MQHVPLLEARSLSFGYEHSQNLISDFNASFVSGEITAITGASGRGKSTLLYMLGLMLPPGDGSLLVEGESTLLWTDKELSRCRARLFGFIFQDAALDSSRSVLDNVVETALYRDEPRAAAEQRARQLLRHFQVEVEAHRRPGQISGGQAQRVALCRALLGEPRIIIADEPTGNLDAATSELVLKAFRDSADEGATVLLATHDMAVAARSDRRIAL